MDACRRFACDVAGKGTRVSSRHMWFNCIVHVNKCFNVDTGVL